MLPLTDRILLGIRVRFLLSINHMVYYLSIFLQEPGHTNLDRYSFYVCHIGPPQSRGKDRPTRVAALALTVGVAQFARFAEINRILEDMIDYPFFGDMVCRVFPLGFLVADYAAPLDGLAVVAAHTGLHGRKTLRGG